MIRAALLSLILTLSSSFDLKNSWYPFPASNLPIRKSFPIPSVLINVERLNASVLSKENGAPAVSIWVKPSNLNALPSGPAMKSDRSGMPTFKEPSFVFPDPSKRLSSNESNSFCEPILVAIPKESREIFSSDPPNHSTLRSLNPPQT